jgi:hypothetical protein
MAGLAEALGLHAAAPEADVLARASELRELERAHTKPATPAAADAPAALAFPPGIEKALVEAKVMKACKAAGLDDAKTALAHRLLAPDLSLNDQGEVRGKNSMTLPTMLQRIQADPDVGRFFVDTGKEIPAPPSVPGENGVRPEPLGDIPTFTREELKL